MTLIVKELVVRGIVVRDNTSSEAFLSEEEIMPQHLEQLKKEIEKDCIDRIMQKLETKTSR
jgi:hypothetical protein